MAYVPAEKPFHLIAIGGVIGDLVRVNERLINQAMVEADYVQALDLIERTMELREYGHSLRKPPHVQYTNAEHLVLAAMFDRPKIIYKAMEFEELALKSADSSFDPRDLYGRDEDVARAQHERNRVQILDSHGHRLAQQKDLLGLIDRYKRILKVVCETPGIKQVDLAKIIDMETSQTTRLVDQLEAAGRVATKKVGTRVCVWPEGHEDGPSPSERRESRWTFGWDPSTATEPSTVVFENPERTASELERLLALYKEAATDDASDSMAKPTPMDFIWPPVDRMAARGNPVHIDTDHLVMAIWGHVDLPEATTIAGELIAALDKQDIPMAKRRKWLTAVPRHCHAERMPFIAQKYALSGGKPGWLLKEVPAQTALSVPVTLIAPAPLVTDPEVAAQKGTSCWLAAK